LRREVSIVSYGMSRFGRRDEEGLTDLMREAATQTLESVDLEKKDLDAVYAASMLAGELSRQTALGTALVDALSLIPLPADRVENGPASGGSAVKQAAIAVASGFYDVVLVVAGEKMRHAPSSQVAEILASMTHPTAEYVQGVTLPSLAGMFARLYMKRYGVERKHLAMVGIKNHENALRNPYAHIHRPLSMEGIYSLPEAEVNNPVVSDPLRLFDCCPITDGAAAVLLCDSKRAREFTDKPVTIAGFGQATDTLAVQDREDPTVLRAVKTASDQAFGMADISPSDVDVAELHDAFTILEIAESEDAGFFEKGTAHEAVEEGVTSLDGELPINTSGGLKARGHPVGATGVAQIVELTAQLREEASDRQVSDATYGYSCNFGGFGNNVLSFVLKVGGK
jgi:acetyl-CoA C-acetyltransferase